MTLAFLTNFMNHHQVHLADELYLLLGDNYKFVETVRISEERIKLGYPIINRPYTIKAYESDAVYHKAKFIVDEADVVIIGSAPEEYVRDRIKAGKMTFRYNERWFKNKKWYQSGLLAWVSYYKNHIRYKSKPLYMLAASAYTANDVHAIGAYKNKVYKWGYFTKVDTSFTIKSKEIYLSKSNCILLMWCGRFLDWKHPELPIYLAKDLKDNGFKFMLDMYGSGAEYQRIQNLVSELQVEDVVNLRGNLPNDQILEQMRAHHIYLFTSDKNEGWGAVLNEAMSCGCAVVSSNSIGATPFLITDGENGLIFESENRNSLYEKVRSLFVNSSYRMKLSERAIETMQQVWCPNNAARQLLKLIHALQMHDDLLIPKSGPCSRALPYK